MAKIYGTLVGQPIQNLQASGFGGVSDRFKDGKDQVLVRDVATFQGNVSGDTVSLALLKSTAYLDPGNSFLWWGALTAGVTLAIGDAAHPTGLGAAFSAATLGTGPLMPGFVGAWMGYPLWQRLGWASDPGGLIELLATIGGGNPPNGQTLAWQIFGRNT